MLASALSRVFSPRTDAIPARLWAFEVSRARVTGGVLLLGAVISLCPLLYAYAPIKGNIIALLAAAAIVVIRTDGYSINRRVIGLTLVLLTTAGICAAYWGQPGMMFIPIYTISAAIAVSVVQRRDANAFVELFTRLTILMLIGAIIGLFYAFFGGPPLLRFSNPDGRLNQLFLTTLTNTQYENFIRPAGLFDEPGALSFIVCCLAALRQALGYNKKVTWTMLVMGLVTMSLAHMLYMIVHGINELWGSRHMMKMLVTTLMVSLALYAIVNFVQPAQDIYSTLLVAKFAVSDGRLVGDNRTDLLLNAAKYINLKSFWFGIDAKCALGYVNCAEQRYGQYGENPLTLLMQWGLLISFPYYLSLAYLGIVAFIRRSLIPLGLLLLLLQRPYTMSFGYSLLILLTIATLAHKIGEPGDVGVADTPDATVAP